MTNKKNTKTRKYHSKKYEDNNLYDEMTVVYNIFNSKNMLNMCHNPYETQ